jgi:hypothetical protein
MGSGLCSNCMLLSIQLPDGAAGTSDMSVLTGTEVSGITSCDDDEEADGVGREDDEEPDGGKPCPSGSPVEALGGSI